MSVCGPSDFAGWARNCARRAEGALEGFLPGPEVIPQLLHQAMRYASLGGGKRVRPLLVYAAGELTGAPLDLLDRVATAVELIHAYSLVHDDMPCMDDDVLRRGKPTVHVAYGEATAMLVGDALQALAFEVLAGAGESLSDGRIAAEMVCELARAAGSLGMVGGQAIDLDSVGQRLSRTDLEAMHRRKTGALLAASVRLGARCGDPSRFGAVRSELDRFASAVGLAFQVVDDVLDVEADSATLGKTAGKDGLNNKPTYVSLMGLESARALARALHAEALESLSNFGPAGGRLAGLTDLIVHRTS
jgi:farnesyl diphosphate synthase